MNAKKICAITLAVALALLICVPGMAQNSSELRLRVSKTFGFSAGNRMQGTFSLRASGPENLTRVVFFVDGQEIGQSTAAPFNMSFNTGNFPTGEHVLSAVGYTTDGEEIRSNDLAAEFVTPQAGMEATGRIAAPILILVFGSLLLSFVMAFVSARNKTKVPLGTEQKYGIAGGAICPRCHRPFPLSMFHPNLGPTIRLAGCPHCGKFGPMRRRSLQELRQAETEELARAGETATLAGMSDEERLRKELENSRYRDL